MILDFKTWLEETGDSTGLRIANTYADDGFSELPSKFVSGWKKQPKSSFDPDRKFGKKSNNRTK